MLKKISFNLLSLFSISTLTLFPIITENSSKQFNYIETDKEVDQKIYFLGDSLSDTGVVVNVVNQMIDQLKQKPEVKFLLGQEIKPLTLPSVCYQNSFSNGKVLSEIIADQFNIPIIPAWDLNLEILGINVITSQIGNNYATAGAKAYIEQEETMKFDLIELLNLKESGNLYSCIFKLLINKFSILDQSKALIKQHSLTKNDIVVIQNGGNDIVGLITKIKEDNSTNLIKDVNHYFDVTINNLHQAILLLLENNLKKIVLTNCSTCYQSIIDYNETKIDLVQLYNDKLHTMSCEIQTKFPNSIKIYDMHNSFMKIKDQFLETNKSIKGAFPINFKQVALNTMFNVNSEVPILQPKDDREIDNYFYLDTSHPTKLVHKIIGEQIYQFIVSNWK